MKYEHRKRLLNVAKACRETKYPNKFDMTAFAHPCGTPACALGNYAARRDLQRTFTLLRSCDSGTYWLGVKDAGEPGGLRIAGFDDDAVEEHFGVNFKEARELFNAGGCNKARTGNEAAEYIERFVERHT